MREKLKALLEYRFEKFNLSKENINDFTEYLFQLKRWNRTSNLISQKMTDENIVDKLLIPSLSFFKLIGNVKKQILDIGSGGGFPAVPIKIYNRNIDISCLEKNYKKTAFLNYVFNKLSLKCNVINTALESLTLKNKPLNVEYITARGVNVTPVFLKNISQLKAHFLIHFTSPKINLTQIKIVDSYEVNGIALNLYRL